MRGAHSSNNKRKARRSAAVAQGMVAAAAVVVGTGIRDMGPLQLPAVVLLLRGAAVKWWPTIVPAPNHLAQGPGGGGSRTMRVMTRRGPGDQPHPTHPPCEAAVRTLVMVGVRPFLFFFNFFCPLSFRPPDLQQQRKYIPPSQS